MGAEHVVRYHVVIRRRSAPVTSTTNARERTAAASISLVTEQSEKLIRVSTESRLLMTVRTRRLVVPLRKSERPISRSAGDAEVAARLEPATGQHGAIRRGRRFAVLELRRELTDIGALHEFEKLL
jgi:transposase